MKIEIRIEGPMACGKTHYSNYLRRMIEANPPITGAEVVIRSTNVPRPKGIDTRGTRDWDTDQVFNV